MTTMREEFVARVEAAQERLDEAASELRWLDARPPGCQCDPRDWGGIPGRVCGRFEPAERWVNGLYCRICEHIEECHTPESGGT